MTGDGGTTNSASSSARLLRLSLGANAFFSSLSGASMLVASKPLAALLGLGDPRLVLATGLNLLAFAALLGWLASRQQIKLGLAWAVVFADLLWVAGSAVLVPADVFSTAGNWIVAGLADVVLGFALIQTLGIRRIREPHWANAR